MSEPGPLSINSRRNQNLSLETLQNIEPNLCFRFLKLGQFNKSWRLKSFVASGLKLEG